MVKLLVILPILALIAGLGLAMNTNTASANHCVGKVDIFRHYHPSPQVDIEYPCSGGVSKVEREAREVALRAESKGFRIQYSTRYVSHLEVDDSGIWDGSEFVSASSVSCSQTVYARTVQMWKIFNVVCGWDFSSGPYNLMWSNTHGQGFFLVNPNNPANIIQQ